MVRVGAGRLTSAKTAGGRSPTVAVADQGPSTPLAVMGGAVAMPCSLLTAVAVVSAKPPSKVAPAPAPLGSMKVTVAPIAGSPSSAST